VSEQDTEALRREIERTRAELGATVEALSHKTDVKAQARAKADQAKLQAREKAEQAKVQAREKAELAKTQAQEKPAIPLAAGIGVAIVALLLIRRKRRS
jgi:ElaB/YqjD/DUF883 family membrane-anchored ribosome-binding protein